MTKLERVLLVLLILAVAADVALLVSDDEEPPPTQMQAQERPAVQRERSSSPPPRTAAERPARTTTTAEVGTTVEEEAPAGDGPPLCAELDIPARPSEAVTCRTTSATLTIVDEADPLLLGDTHVRVLSAHGEGGSLTVRARVRNETDAEQGVQAGGQELYLNLNGIRVDPGPVRDVRVPPRTGTTLPLEFRLTPGQTRILNAQGRRAELGVRPWTSGEQAANIGVIRFFARPGEPPAATGG